MSFKKTCLIILFLSACGGGGSGDSDSGIVFQGTLRQGSDTARLAHEAGEGIEGVQVCALGSCSTTDRNGQWGFGVEQAPTEIAFSVTGRDINSTWTIIIPSTAKDVTIELENHSDGIHSHDVIADGQIVDQTHNHNDGHNHG